MLVPKLPLVTYFFFYWSEEASKVTTEEKKNGTGSKIVGTIADIEFVPKQVDGRVSESPKTQVADVTDNFEDNIPF